MTAGFASLRGKSGLVTGAGSGIGRASAIRLASIGGKVIVSDINEDAAFETAELIRGAGGTAEVVCGDVSSADFADHMVAETLRHFGGIDFAHNNAGIETPIAPTADAEEADFDRSILVNLKGVWLCMRAELREMARAQSGSIVNTASVGGLTGVPGAAAYSAAKHGVIGLSKSAAIEYATSGVRVNAICPGLTRSGMTERLMKSSPDLIKSVFPPIQRLADPEEIASAVAYMLSDDASYLTGHAMAVDGGATAV
jgi:NAD(P)-dependent dehydrogenase (short-subunit alcohol dehydrogenase family)